MRRFTTTFFTMLFALTALPLWALRPGDDVTEIAALKWVGGLPVSVLPARNAKLSPAKVVLFFQTTDFNSREALTILDQLRRTYGRRCRFAAVTPSPEPDARAFLTGFPDSLSVAVDHQRELTSAYMEKSSFFPMAFIVSPEGKIVWNGEAIDLPEALAKYFGGRLLNRKDQRELSLLLDELRLHLRESNDARMKKTVRQIFKLDPANAAAIRIRLFVLQSSGRQEEAWKFLIDRLEEAPEVKRLYFTAIDLAGATPGAAARVNDVVRRYQEKITKDPEADALLAWTLLQRRPEDGEALAAAIALGRRAEKNMTEKTPPAQRASLQSTLALICCRLGQLDKALKHQHEAVTLLERAGLTAAARSAKMRENYYRAAHSLSQRNP